MLKAPISKKTIKQVGILFVDDTNLWSGLAPDDDVHSAMAKGQEDKRSGEIR